MPLPAGPHSYLLLWTQDYCRQLRRAGDLGNPLVVAYGGEHTSQPLISRYGVESGDTLYTVGVTKGTMYVIGGMIVSDIVPWRDYVDSWEPGDLGKGHRKPWGCRVEAVLGTNGAPLALDRAVPEEVATGLVFVDKSGKERPLRQVKDGKITSVIGLQGHALRLRVDAAEAFRRLTWPDAHEATVA